MFMSLLSVEMTVAIFFKILDFKNLGSRPMRPRRAIGVSDMGCNKIEPDSIEDGIVKSVNQRKRATTPEGRMIIDEHIKLFQKTLLALNKMKRGKQKMMIEIQNN